MSQLDSIEEAVHLRDVHWVPVPESGSCPASHPNRLKSPEGQTRCYTDSAAAVLRRRSRESNTEFEEQERPPLKTQTYILSKERFKTQAEADKWMDDNNAPRPKVDEKENTFRYRQFDPDRCEEGSARTIRITDGVQIVGCRLKPEFREAVTPFKDLPLAERTRAWDSGEAMARVRRWASTDDKIDFDRYSMAFLVVDGPRENLTSYKLPFADFFDNRLRAVPRGIFAAAAVLQGARGGIDLPSGDLPRAQNHLGQYYSKMELRAPWDTEESMSEQVEKLTNERANLREANPDNQNERCSLCVYFKKPTICQIVEGPVAADLVCDWIDSTGQDPELYKVSDEDWLAFVKGMVEKQPYQHIVIDGAITPEGPVVLIEDTAKPPHRFSLTRPFHITHTVESHHWTQAEVDALVNEGKGEDESEPEEPVQKAENLEEGIRPAFGSPGGKKYLAQKIVSLIPDHKKYCEPFIGGGAVFFAKRVSPKEVINDKDGDIAHAYRFIKGISESDVSQLKQRRCTFSRDQFFKLRDSNGTANSLERFYRFIYTNAFSFGRTRTSTTLTADGILVKDLGPRFERFFSSIKSRLGEVSISGYDFREVIRANNSPDTFFYLDPPYPDQQGHLKTGLTNEDIRRAVKTIRGKFILSLPNTADVRRTFSEYHIKKVSVRRTLEMKAEHHDQEVLISNFPMRASNAWLAEAIPQSALSESFRIDLTYKPDEEPTHEELEGRRQEIMKKFADFVKAEFPKGEVKVELENLIPKEAKEQEDVRDARFFLFDIQVQEVLPDGRRGPSFKVLKKNQVRLPEDERDIAMKAKAFWHHSQTGEAKETCAIWKSVVRGEAWYVCHTHRAMNVRPTLKAAIKQFHDLIKGMA